MKKLVLLIVCITILSACKADKQTSYELCGYGSMMVIDGKDYLRVNLKKTLTLGQQVGKIKLQLDENYHPIENFSSNSLESGSTVYSVKGHNNYLIAKTPENKYLLYEEIN